MPRHSHPHAPSSSLTQSSGSYSFRLGFALCTAVASIVALLPVLSNPSLFLSRSSCLSFSFYLFSLSLSISLSIALYLFLLLMLSPSLYIVLSLPSFLAIFFCTFSLSVKSVDLWSLLSMFKFLLHVSTFTMPTLVVLSACQVLLSRVPGPLVIVPLGPFSISTCFHVRST